MAGGPWDAHLLKLSEELLARLLLHQPGPVAQEQGLCEQGCQGVSRVASQRGMQHTMQRLAGMSMQDPDAMLAACWIAQQNKHKDIWWHQGQEAHRYSCCTQLALQQLLLALQQGFALLHGLLGILNGLPGRQGRLLGSSGLAIGQVGTGRTIAADPGTLGCCCILRTILWFAFVRHAATDANLASRRQVA